MASDLSFVEYVRDQMHGAGAVTFKKMFGEYALYIDEKIVALVCDNQLFVKPTKAGRALLGAVTEASPYAGAKPQLLIREQLEDQELVVALMRATAAELPMPKPKPVKNAAKKTAKRSR